MILGYDEGSHDGDEVKLYHRMQGMSSLYIAVIEGRLNFFSLLQETPYTVLINCPVRQVRFLVNLRIILVNLREVMVVKLSICSSSSSYNSFHPHA